MVQQNDFRIPLLILLMCFSIESALACSMYKITVADKTIVGTNFDAYYLTPTIWFESKTTAYKYGAVYSGGRIDGAYGIAPQSGMNEAGLSFSRLAAPTPEHGIDDFLNKRKIIQPTLYLKTILHQCKNVEEVQQFINEYDHSFFQEDVFIYIDTSGKYLIVEPYKMHVGKDANYVLSNFCPSVTSSTYAHKLKRYHKGVELLKNKCDTSLAFATSLSDTMHVCREKLGDGTLLSSIWDLKEGTVSLYFYHDYKHLVQFNLQNELKKGDHQYDIAALFPLNTEFETLKHYQVPQNNLFMRWSFLYCGLVFLLTIVYFSISYFKRDKNQAYRKVRIMLVLLAVALIYYLFCISSHNAILYTAAPYKDYRFSMLDIASYIPIVTLPVFIYLIFINWKVLQSSYWSVVSRIIFSLNSIAYLMLIVLFSYWQLYDVF